MFKTRCTGLTFLFDSIIVWYWGTDNFDKFLVVDISMAADVSFTEYLLHYKRNKTISIITIGL